jgi:hypothetical protein
MKLKKVAYCSALLYFSLSSMHKVVGEDIFTKHFFQNSSASPIKLLMKLFSKK